MDINVILNGETRVIPDGTSIEALLDQLGIKGRRLAVEVDGEVIPRSSHATRTLANGERVEVVHAIGGG